MEGLAAVLPQEAWHALLRAGHPRRFRRDERLLRQGDDGTHVLLLTRGRVKVSRHECDGREVLLAVRGPGEALGDISALDGAPRSATVVALDTCIAYALPTSRFRRILHTFESGDLLLRHVIARLRESEDSRADLTDLTAPQRIARILLRLGTASAPSPPSSPARTIDLGLSQEELARAVGVSRSTMAAELARLRRDGLVSTGRQRIVLHDLAGLRAVLAPRGTGGAEK